MSSAQRLPSLIQQARGGSTEALGRLLEICRPYLLAMANEEMAADLQAKAGASDLVQQTFLEAQSDFDQFQGNSEEDLIGWLRSVLRNNLANFTRQYRSSAKRNVGREVGLSSRLDLVDDSPSPGSNAIAREQLAAIERALNRLPDDYQTVIRLRQLGRQSFAEIAQTMQRSPEAIRKLWARAVERLLQELKHERS